MFDLSITLENRPGALAEMGEALGRAGVSIEGGGAWVVDGRGVAHFLFHDGEAARRALEAAGITVLEVREVLSQRLNQDEPGQLGKLTRRMADAGVNIDSLYSDHEHQLILTVATDGLTPGRTVSETWEQERIARQSKPHKQHTYRIQTNWAGNDGPGTTDYRSYRRDFTLTAAGKPTIPGSSDPAFRGDPTRYNPEELLVASLSSCHMLWYLHLCAVSGVVVLDYQDEAIGTMDESTNGSGNFSQVLLRPKVRITDPQTESKARELHEEAHKLCFIARSVNFPVNIEPEILTTP
ncbi:MAG TPA: OsmC family protein [Granulicella sp.]